MKYINLNMYDKILLPIDGLYHSFTAAEHAIYIACKMNSSIITLNVVENNYVELTPQYGLINRLEKVLEENGRESLNKISQKLNEIKIQEQCEGIKITSLLRTGNSTKEILKTIEEENIDLVVMGRSNKRGLNRLLMGSTTSKVVRLAPCPVLIVP